MLVKYFLPHPALREYVRLFQIVHLKFADNVVVPSKYYWPRPEHCLAFNPRQKEAFKYVDAEKLIVRPPITLIGQASMVTNRYVPHDFFLFQIVFEPGALFRLTGIPSGELTDTFLDGEGVFSNEIRLVSERLNSTDNYEEMTGIVENYMHYLIKRRKRTSSKTGFLPIDKVAKFMTEANPMFNSGHMISLDKLAHEACLSPKQFYKNFVERMGISPKAYARIVRFDNAMKLQNAQPHKDWQSIALDCGYYDYQHMAKDFKDFTRATPIEFAEKENQAPERLFGLKEDF